METIKDSKDPPENYWKDYADEPEDEDEDLNASNTDISRERLINGISIKDLCDGREIMFQTGKSFCDNDFDDSEDEIHNEITHCDLKSLREKRGAPPLSCSFKEIASKMTNLIEDGFVKKQVVSSGIGKIVPDNAYVTVHYNLYKESCELPFDSTYLRNRPEKFKLGQGEALLGLEIAVKSMKKNENSRFFIKWELAFGALGCPDRIGEKCDIVADITLMNFMEIQTEVDASCVSGADKSNMDFAKLISHTKKLHYNGSDEFSKGDTKNAISSYRKALKILDSMKLANEEQENIVLRQKVKCLVNLAICYNKLGKHEQACVACQDALAIDGNSVKAHFHYGRASIALSNFGFARKCLLRANNLKPNDVDINKEMKKLNDKKALYEMQDKMFWRKALEVENNDGNSQEGPSPLEEFEKQLLTSLEESLKEDKSYSLPTPLSEEKMNICRKLAAEMNFSLETCPGFCTFRTKNETDPEEKSGNC